MSKSGNTSVSADIAVGKDALATYGTPSTDELEDTIRPTVADHDAILLANHGAMTFGRDVTSAYNRMEALEQLARISAMAHLVGEARQLSPDEIVRLENIRGVYGTVDKNVPCFQCGWNPQQHSDHSHASSSPSAPSWACSVA